MDQDETTTTAAEEPTAAPEPERGPIVATIQVRVTLRDQVGGDGESTHVPTNAAIEQLVEAAFRAGGYAYVNATAEKV